MTPKKPSGRALHVRLNEPLRSPIHFSGDHAARSVIPALTWLSRVSALDLRHGQRFGACFSTATGSRDSPGSVTRRVAPSVHIIESVSVASVTRVCVCVSECVYVSCVCQCHCVCVCVVSVCVCVCECVCVCVCVCVCE